MFSRTLAALLLSLVIIEATPTERELKQNKVPLISDDDEPPAASGELANFSGDGSDEIEDQTRFVTDEAVKKPAGRPHELPVLTPTLSSSGGNREAHASYLFSPTRPLFAAPESSDVRNHRQPTPVQLDPNLLINQYAAPQSQPKPHSLAAAAGAIPGMASSGSHGQAVGSAAATAQHHPYYRPPTGVQSLGKPQPVLTAAAPRPPPVGGREPHAHSHSIVPPSEFFNGINVQQPPKKRPKPHSSFIPPKNTAGANYPTITGGQQGNVGHQHTAYFPSGHAQGNPYPEAQQQCQSPTIASRGLYDQIEHIAPACRRNDCGASCESKAPDFMLDLRTKKISYSQFYSDGRYVFPPNYWRRSAQIHPKRCDQQTTLVVRFPRPKNGNQKARLKVDLYWDKPGGYGYMFHAADAKPHNKYSQRGAAGPEVYIKDQFFYAYASREPGYQYHSFDSKGLMFRNNYKDCSKISIIIGDQSLQYYNHRDTHVCMASQYLFLTNGQCRRYENPRDRDIHLGLNKVAHSRSKGGSGLCAVTLTWLD